MEKVSDMLLLQAIQAWCDDCAGERILVPADEDGPGGYCCTSCDSAVFVLEVGAHVDLLRRSA